MVRAVGGGETLCMFSALPWPLLVRSGSKQVTDLTFWHSNSMICVFSFPFFFPLKDFDAKQH